MPTALCRPPLYTASGSGGNVRWCIVSGMRFVNFNSETFRQDPRFSRWAGRVGAQPSWVWQIAGLLAALVIVVPIILLVLAAVGTFMLCFALFAIAASGSMLDAGRAGAALDWSMQTREEGFSQAGSCYGVRFFPTPAARRRAAFGGEAGGRRARPPPRGSAGTPSDRERPGGHRRCSC